MFFIRDPLSRFVSAFNSRLREGRPRYHYPWREEERIAFAVFRTPDQLGSALSSDDPAQREQAEQAMRSIGHLSACIRSGSRTKTRFVRGFPIFFSSASRNAWTTTSNC